MKSYNHLIGYLHRWTVCKIGQLHVRLHHILTADGTPFLHTHPFMYVSVILSGGYTEQVLIGGKLVTIEHVAPAIVFRRASTYHRIVEVVGACKTLFFAYGSSPWNLTNHPNVERPATYEVPTSAGIYVRIINGVKMYSKFENGMWYVGTKEMCDAHTRTTLSVHQCGKWEMSNV